FYLVFFFFFQAEDGIRDFHVTGVQTCALPICHLLTNGAAESVGNMLVHGHPSVINRVYGGEGCLPDQDARPVKQYLSVVWDGGRSEERRVGKEGRDRM